MGQFNFATFGGGCFWCLEAIYSEIKGIFAVESGYSGGHTKNPSYEDVCSETTGHAEVIHIKYDENTVKFEELLSIFFTIHDPTTLNRQGYDVGTQYRSAIFFHSLEQKLESERFINSLVKKNIFKNIVTQVTEFTKFYKAEEYHQSYYDKNPGNAYCEYNITPKLTKFRTNFKHFLTSDRS